MTEVSLDWVFEGQYDDSLSVVDPYTSGERGTSKGIGGEDWKLSEDGTSRKGVRLDSFVTGHFEDTRRR